MKIQFLSFFVALLIILSVQKVRGGSNHIHGKEWVDPDPLSNIYRDRASKTVRKESRLVTSVVCYFAVSLYDDNLRVKTLFIYIFLSKVFLRVLLV
jgi:hypothetical protein